MIVPALRPDAELRRCLDSVRLVFPDPGTCEIVLVLPADHLREGLDCYPGVRVVAETRRGVYGAMNDGVAASLGQFVYFLGKDDIVLPAMGEAAALLQTTRPRALFCDVYWGDEGVRRGRPLKWLLLIKNVCQQGILYSRATVLQHGPFLRKLRVQADHLLNIRVLWEPGHARVAYFPVPVAWYAGTGLSFRSRDTQFHRVHAAIIGRYLGPAAACLWRGYRKLRPEKLPPHQG
ncbi:glycosyltransferase family 2 protein [Ramlibacter sp.]|uniref:glycosyltransferase family 2 protein n=1 Tax=Ramlibacter sp. TaxID=1917967 RepID=UPI002CD22A9D|nr:glycosyltransferase [Ramlibacter sp.]HWI84197.1 glycosyltransferase [Ramlibacter sp.]